MEKKKEVKKTKKTTPKKVATTKTQKSVEVKEKATVKAKETPKVEAIKTVEPAKKTKKTKNHGLFKVLAICIFVAIVLTWIIPTGYFSAGEYTKGAIARTGINEIFLSMFYSTNYYLLQIIFILGVGVFYGVISKTKGYNAFVEKLASIFKGKEKLFVLLNTLIIALFVSFATQFFPILIFIPVMISVAKKLGFSRLNSIAMTFGAMMCGFTGATYTTYGISYINQNMSTTTSSALGIRFGILAIAYILLNALIFIKMNKEAKENKNLEIADPFTPENSEKGKSLGFFILFGILFVLVVLGYMPWSNSFGIDAFTKLKLESEFQKLSPGGAISYIETPNLENNLDVVMEVIEYIYNNIMYAELNTKSDYCQACGYTGEILIDDNLEWYCPNCGNRDHDKLNVARRTCGYIGTNFWNKGRTEEIKERVMHIDNKDA